MDDLPEPVVPVVDGLIGLAALTAAWIIASVSQLPVLLATWLVLYATALPLLWRERRRASPSLAGGNEPFLWLVGAAILLPIGVAIHAQARPIDLWIIAAAVVCPGFLVRMILERKAWFSGALPKTGGWILRRGLAPPWSEIRLWALKAVFLPLYGASLFYLVGMGIKMRPDSPAEFILLVTLFAYTVDLGFGLSGYLFASNNLASTVRSTQPLLSGWLACLICYAPIFSHWPAFERTVLTEIQWPRLLGIAITPLELIVTILMLGLLALYVSATVVFGLRFSNLSNRGTITSGPYRLMKHPAYFAHVCNSWLIVFVLFPLSGIALDFSMLLVPPAFTLFYWLRAVTEEKHMREDERYRQYEAWIAKNGLVARLISAVSPSKRVS